MSPCWSSPGICASGEEAALYKDSNRWLDFTSDWRHRHRPLPPKGAAAQEQVAKLVHAQYATVTHPNSYDGQTL